MVEYDMSAEIEKDQVEYERTHRKNIRVTVLPEPTQRKTTYTFFSDPAHGWLKVPKKKLEELGIAKDISQYSYESKDGKYAYLEEDSDAGKFIDALKAKGEPYGHRESQTNSPSFIRKLPIYMGFKPKQNPFEQEFMEAYKGDPSVGIRPMSAEQARDALLEDYYVEPENVRQINMMYNRVKRDEARMMKVQKSLESDFWREQEEDLANKIKTYPQGFGLPEEARRYSKQKRLAEARALLRKNKYYREPLKSNRGQGGYFRHRKEHSINRRKARRR